MSNKSYGIKKEREVIKILKDRGAVNAIRARGSFGKFDVIALFDTYSLWISVKSGSKGYIKTCLRDWQDIPPDMPTYHNVQIWTKERNSSVWEIFDRHGEIIKGAKQ